MRQFFSLRKSSTPGGAAQPASERDTSVSAERPVSQLQSLKDVQTWLATDCGSLDTAEIGRLRDAVQVLAKAKPRQEDIRLLQKPSNWNVTTTIKKKPRPLPDVIEELRVKVVETARQVQRELMASAPSGSGSVARPAPTSAEQPAPVSAEQPGPSSAAPPTLTIALASSSSAAAFVEQSRRQREELQENQRKRNQASEPEPPRALAKPKPSGRRGKRSSQEEEQLPSQPKRGKLTTESFAVSAAPLGDGETIPSSAG